MLVLDCFQGRRSTRAHTKPPTDQPSNHTQTTNQLQCEQHPLSWADGMMRGRLTASRRTAWTSGGRWQRLRSWLEDGGHWVGPWFGMVPQLSWWW